MLGHVKVQSCRAFLLFHFISKLLPSYFPKSLYAHLLKYEYIAAFAERTHCTPYYHYYCTAVLYDTCNKCYKTIKSPSLLIWVRLIGVQGTLRQGGGSGRSPGGGWFLPFRGGSFEGSEGGQAYRNAKFSPLPKAAKKLSTFNTIFPQKCLKKGSFWVKFV